MSESTPEMPSTHLAESPPESSSSNGQGDEPAAPAQLGRYRITGRLGRGGFGTVYKGYDEDLRRDVAIKVPHRQRVASTRDADAYLAEARILAGLNHPGIVPVYDVGRSDDGLCYVVSQFIEGDNLARRMHQGRLAHVEATQIIAGVAEALHHAHQRGLVHRDIKPANILLDAQRRPVVVDFGLALRDRHFGTGPTFAGTPAYMSPEQARGEGHRVDARSDVYSLGVVLYELLTGSRPYRGDSLGEVLEQIRTLEPRPCRQLDDAIPKELDRICQKALAKRAAERYSTAIDFADDLRHWLAHATATPPDGQVPASATPPAANSARSDMDRHLINVVPKGLRSYDASDADFFLELLPGPRDREGLPESIRFWKRAVLESDPDKTFSVGLIYGPSGCGKSSLVKAGLLPRLDERSVTLYLEATPEDTEARLLKGLRRRCPNLPEDLTLVDTLACLRSGQGVPLDRKVLIVLDQFEQWLHARREEQHTELVQALRHCDGTHVQCIVMVRDDFWMAATRFMRDLEVRLIEGQNSAAVDLFDLRHARKVLTAFGRAFGCLPDKTDAFSTEQNRFLDQASAGLAQDGKVISVRISLFTEMVKSKPWTSATLKEVGGMEGIGETFLEETFSAATAPPEHRLHQKAARAVLQALLPPQGTDIKGHMRSYQELLDASGYARQPREFAELLRILDTELRLVTPAESDGNSDAGLLTPSASDEPPSLALAASVSSHPSSCYQLTHDYLVPALRQWLTRKQRETRRGRAALMLAERAAQWNAHPEWRQLPTPWEGLKILLFTRRCNRTASERRMLTMTNWLRIFKPVFSGAVLAVVGVVLVWALVEWAVALHISMLLHNLQTVETAQVPRLVVDLTQLRRWSQPRLEQLLREAPEGSKARLHASLALLPRDRSQVNYLLERMLSAKEDELPVIRTALEPHRDRIVERLWDVLDSDAEASRRFRAACALAAYDRNDPTWLRVRDDVAAGLVAQNPLALGHWAEMLRPVRLTLIPPLLDMTGDANRPETTRLLARSILADYAADQPEVLAEMAGRK